MELIAKQAQQSMLIISPTPCIILAIINIFSLVGVQDFEKHSKLVIAGTANLIWRIREVIWSVRQQNQITRN
jgi:hypothetical protein